MPWTFSCQLPRAVSSSTGIASPASRQRRKHGEPVDFRQPEVEHDGVIALGLPEKIRPLAVSRRVDGIPASASAAASCSESDGSSSTTRTRKTSLYPSRT